MCAEDVDGVVGGGGGLSRSTARATGETGGGVLRKTRPNVTTLTFQTDKSARRQQWQSGSVAGPG